jgi:hypothetical protein
MIDCKKDWDSGNCQHIQYLKVDDSWIIPSGTHYFGGHTVFVASSSDSAGTSHPRDELAKDLREILEDPANLSDDALDAGCMNSDKQLEDLLIYLVARDHKILQHGVELGKATNA